MKRRPNLDDITTARLWAETNCGEDNPLDCMEWKLIEMWASWHEDTSEWHRRKSEQGRKRMAELESAFEITGPTEEF